MQSVLYVGKYEVSSVSYKDIQTENHYWYFKHAPAYHCSLTTIQSLHT